MNLHSVKKNKKFVISCQIFNFKCVFLIVYGVCRNNKAVASENRHNNVVKLQTNLWDKNKWLIKCLISTSTLIKTRLSLMISLFKCFNNDTRVCRIKCNVCFANIGSNLISSKIEIFKYLLFNVWTRKIISIQIGLVNHVKLIREKKILAKNSINHGNICFQCMNHIVSGSLLLFLSYWI